VKQSRSKKNVEAFESVSIIEYPQIWARLRTPWQRIFVNLQGQNRYLLDWTGKFLINQNLRFETLHEELQQPQNIWRFRQSRCRNLISPMLAISAKAS